MVFLVAVLSFLANNISAFLIVESFIKGYMLISSTDAIVASYLFISSSSSLSFRSDMDIYTWKYGINIEYIQVNKNIALDALSQLPQIRNKNITHKSNYITETIS